MLRAMHETTPKPRLCAVLWLAALAALAAGCGRDEAAPPAKRAAAAAAPAPSAARAPSRVEFIDALPVEEDASSVIRREMDRARADRRALVVYVGAPWCEPCQRFHEAAIAGKLDDVLPGTRFIAFDHDRDIERLTRAGYASKLIPLFAIPSPDGSAGPLRIQGSVKGDAAVDQIVPRLAAILAKSRQQP